MAVMTVFYLVLAIISGRWQRFVPVTIMVTFVGLYLDATLRGKFVVWAQLLDTLGLRGDERILDPVPVCIKRHRYSGALLPPGCVDG